jgi:hypothetical protein
MKRQQAILLALSAALVLLEPIDAAAARANGKQRKACRERIWQQAEFRDLPKAAIVLEPGRVYEVGDARVHWTANAADFEVHGACRVGKKGDVLEFRQYLRTQRNADAKTDAWYDVRRKEWRTADGANCKACKKRDGWERPRTDGPFYYDTRSRSWRDSHSRGAACASCTPENGFPAAPL